MKRREWIGLRIACLLLLYLFIIGSIYTNDELLVNCFLLSLCDTVYYSSWPLDADCKFGVGSEVLDLVFVRAARHRSYYFTQNVIPGNSLLTRWDDR